MRIRAGIELRVTGRAMRVRKEDKALVDDLRAKLIPEPEIERIVNERQTNAGTSPDDISQQ